MMILVLKYSATLVLCNVAITVGGCTTSSNTFKSNILLLTFHYTHNSSSNIASHIKVCCHVMSQYPTFYITVTWSLIILCIICSKHISRPHGKPSLSLCLYIYYSAGEKENRKSPSFSFTFTIFFCLH